MAPDRTDGDPPAGDSSGLARLFLKLGVIAFGGPAAHIAMMEDEVVTRRGWMRRDHFLDLVGATNLIPGPNSTEMTMHVGYERAGLRGLLVAHVPLTGDTPRGYNDRSNESLTIARRLEP